MKRWRRQDGTLGIMNAEYAALQSQVAIAAAAASAAAAFFA
jgi:hypothetical protein